MSRIRVNIDRLVVGGLDAEARHAFVASLKGELGKILAEPVLRRSLMNSRRTPAMRLGDAHLEPGTTGAGKLGAQVARGIGKGLKA
ncbi:MAG TPA: hypothetical protein VHD85_20700 [Terracidiphilus sp.]|nr:hypothetical protein [Terracidiphilus sp.]